MTLTLASEFTSRGIEVDIVLMSCDGELLDQVPETVSVVDLKATRIRQVPLAFARYLDKQKPSAVIANMWPLTNACIVARFIAKSKARLVVCEHVTLSNSYRDWGLVHRIFLRQSIAALYPLADARVSVSTGVASDLSALAGISRSRFDVIYNPIVIRSPSSSAAAEVDAAWRGWSGKRILSVGTLKKQKNQAILIRAFSRMVEKDDARLMILGEGFLRDELESLARELGIYEKVLLPGFFMDPAPIYGSANLFVLSSDYEGFGNVIVEALACGLPVVSTDCPSGPAEILENGRYGRLVPVRDAEALAKAMGEALAADHDLEALKRRAAEFSPERAADQYLALMFPDNVALQRGRHKLGLEQI